MKKKIIVAALGAITVCTLGLGIFSACKDGDKNEAKLGEFLDGVNYYSLVVRHAPHRYAGDLVLMLTGDLVHLAVAARLELRHLVRKIVIEEARIPVVIIHGEVHFRDLYVKSELVDVDDELFEHLGVEGVDVVMRLKADAVDLAALFEKVFKKHQKLPAFIGVVLEILVVIEFCPFL